MSLLNFFANLTIDAMRGMAADKSTMRSRAGAFKKLYSGEPLTVSEFEELYDMRRFNAGSRRSDIKILKERDEPGVYVLTNVTKDKSYVGKGNKVFRKVFRQINGHGNADVFADLSGGDNFEIIVYTLSRSGFDDLNDLLRDAVDVFGSYF